MGWFDPVPETFEDIPRLIVRENGCCLSLDGRFELPRPLPAFCNYNSLPGTPTFGSYGDASMSASFERLIKAVETEYDEARIILQLAAGPA